MGKSPGAESRDRSPGPKGRIAADKRPRRGPDREAGETIPPGGKTRARAKAAPGKAAPGNDAATAKPRAGKGKPSAHGKSAPGKSAGAKTARPAPRKAFLVAATLADGGGAPNLRVYAAVVRSAEAALAAVRAEIGDDAAVELTGSLSTRMAKTLGLRPDEIRQI